MASLGVPVACFLAAHRCDPLANRLDSIGATQRFHRTQEQLSLGAGNLVEVNGF